MFLLNEPIITKFLSNKIESSKNDWPDYLLEIAKIFFEFDGMEFDRDGFLERFTLLTNRSPYSLRDPSNFRDEFGAYMSYLGVCHIERSDSAWKVMLSDSARHFLCVPEPDVRAFCLAQMVLFQYPNGAGAVHSYTKSGNLSIRVQANVFRDTQKEVNAGLKIVPLRLICKTILAKYRAYYLNLNEITLSYKEIFALFNDSRTNRTPNPTFDNILAVIEEVESGKYPAWVHDQYLLGKFKRNFHIFDHTGLLKRIPNGISLVSGDGNTLEMITVISDIDVFFDDFYKDCGTTEDIASVIKSDRWGKYFDAANLPANILSKLTDSVFDLSTSPLYVFPKGEKVTIEPSFPTLVAYENSSPSHKKGAPVSVFDPEVARIKREKANRDHARLVERIASLARLAGVEPYENLFMDLYVEMGKEKYIFEVKSCNPSNLLSQIRKGISQLYEYRYRSKQWDANLCLVLQYYISEDWLIEYLVRDRTIAVCWLIDEVRLEYPEECRVLLPPFLI